ncbi:oxidoreductase [Brevundimonas sp. S30B]|uniref:PDR/VanB family oxidoreductase n=1 Tax=unclassified Brevundimonas TaxID=2622653 RepID=UPI00107262B5|nr:MULTISPECIES: PDR/VanB family oxidoreductase [unclassified Brevundimonas]QBX36669.1 oxidoreductase [Brevundimonas sp. MF30-B]TFW04536.1 oxidoreductase [Brevundimonas sp. S30B]
MEHDSMWIPAVLRRIEDVAEDIRLFEIEPDGGATPYPTGSHIEIEVLIGDEPATRSYSLVGAGPTEGVWRIAVKRLPQSRGGSERMWALAPGARLRIARPTSHFELRPGAPSYLLLAGGIGITPMVGMVEALAAAGADARLVYAVRSRSQAAFLDRLAGRLDLRVDDEGAVVDLDAEIAGLHPEGEMYVCGPVGLMEAARRAWSRAGRPAERLRMETFGSSGHHPAQDFVVHVADRDLTLTVPANRSLLDALAGAGVDVASDCKRGECGLCAVQLVAVAGEVDHRDLFLSDHQKMENALICACVSRAVGTVTVDTGHRAHL